MKHFVLYSVLPFLLIAAFVAIMNAGVLLKKPFSQDDDVMYYLELTNDNIEQQKWQQAEKNLKKMEKAFNNVVKRIQYSVERDELNEFTTSLNRAKGFIEANEAGGAKAELKEAQYLWEDLGK